MHKVQSTGCELQALQQQAIASAMSSTNEHGSKKTSDLGPPLPLLAALGTRHIQHTQHTTPYPLSGIGGWRSKGEGRTQRA
jgi:hypothetical protein